MRFSSIMEILQRNQSATDWVRVDNENGDGGNIAFCVEDVSLCVKFGLRWKQNNPFASYQITYASTVLSWFELPLVSTDQVPNHADVLTEVERRLAAQLS
jgi:hypothetical protein